MKKMVSLMVFLMLMAIVTTGYAQVRPGSFTVSPTIGGYKFEGNEDMNTSLTVGLRAGYNFTKYIGVEGYAHYIPVRTNYVGEWTGGNGIDVVGYGIEGIVNILPNGAFVPFIAAGVGGIYYSQAWEVTTESRNNKVTVDYGAGVKYFVTENVALRGDVRHVIPFDGRHNNLLYTVGLMVAFGGEKKAIAPAPAPVEPTPAPVVAPAPPPPPPPAPAPVVEEVKPQAQAAPEIIQKGRTTLRVLFDTNKSIIKKNSFRDVDNLVAVMKQYPDLNVTIEGHTDNVGTAAYNKKLSQQRAEAVKTYMVKKGRIDAKRLNAKGFGLEKPIASNATKAGKAQNRRVEAATAEYVIEKK